jgi:hypothetical protein
MTITKPKATAASVEAFIAAAPDGAGAPRAPENTVRKQITFTIPIDQLARVDEVATALGLSRAGYINMSIYRQLARDAQQPKLES